MNAERLYDLQQRSVELLAQLISIPSFSKEEQATAAHIATFLEGDGVTVNKHLNNIWAVNKYFDPSKQTILLNSHHDTVRPNAGYTLDPFQPIQKDGKL